MSDVQWTAFILRPACMYTYACVGQTPFLFALCFLHIHAVCTLPTPCRCDVKGLTQKGEPPLHLYSIYVWCNLEACLCFESNLYIRMLDFGLLWPAWHVKELNVPWCSINCQSCIHVKELKRIQTASLMHFPVQYIQALQGQGLSYGHVCCSWMKWDTSIYLYVCDASQRISR